MPIALEKNRVIPSPKQAVIIAVPLVGLSLVKTLYPTFTGADVAGADFLAEEEERAFEECDFESYHEGHQQYHSSPPDLQHQVFLLR